MPQLLPSAPCAVCVLGARDTDQGIWGCPHFLSLHFPQITLQSVSRPWSALEPWGSLGLRLRGTGEQLKTLSFPVPGMEAPGEERFLEDARLGPALSLLDSSRVGEASVQSPGPWRPLLIPRGLESSSSLWRWGGACLKGSVGRAGTPWAWKRSS